MARKKQVDRLYRNKKDSIVGGVCSGIADYLETDPTLVRLLWILITLISAGLGLLAYLLFWVIIPMKK
jgi:phage shock protein C